MTGRERMTNILNGKPTDRVSWTTISDGITRANMPDDYKNIPILDFYRKIGCDIFQFGPYGLPSEIGWLEPYRIESDITDSYESLPDGSYSHIRSLGKDSITSSSKSGHPTKYPIVTVRDLELYYEMVRTWRIFVSDDGFLERCARCEEAIGQDGIYTPTFSPSPVQQLIEIECGLENFYHLLADEPQLMERTIDAMFEICRQKYEIMAEKAPFEAFIPVENTSTRLISPTLYRKYSLPHIREFCSIMHRHGKKAIIHMCGHLYNLLHEFKETGMDGIHAVTPPPLGDCPFDSAFDVLGEDLIIIGVLDGFQSPNATAEDIRNCVFETITPRIRSSNFILAIGTDGLQTDLWRIEVVRDAVEEMG
ncbi:MAG: hypothetical protein FWF15_10695 [Oscillospiraceae bacterium]|nr:hypothetical protein [Oscillospiraceae bacterium]